MSVFDGLPAQPRALRLLEAAAAAPAHAYLLSGPAGSTSAATPSGSPPRCSHCPPQRIESRGHPDLFLVEPEGRASSSTGARRLRRDLHLRPFEAERRVYLMLDAHLLRDESANALLKSLEEPPEYAVFVLVSDHAERMLPTIRSRVQAIVFRRYSTAALAAVGRRGGRAGGARRPRPRERLATDPAAAERHRSYLGSPGSLLRPRVRPVAAGARLLEASGQRARPRPPPWAASATRASRRSTTKRERALRKRSDERAKRESRRAEWDELRVAVDTIACGTATCSPRRWERVAWWYTQTWPRGSPRPRRRVARDSPSAPWTGRRRPSVARGERASGAGRRGALPPSRPGARIHTTGSLMATVVGVVFQPGGKIYSFDPAGLELRWDERVICQTSRGREFGRVVQTPNHVPDEELTGPLKRVIRRASPADEEQVRRNRLDAKRALLLFRELSGRHELELKPISAELVFDASRIIFSFSADERLDTHELQSDLGDRLNRRVELRRSARARRPGCAAAAGCAAPRCAARGTPPTRPPITLRMAKDQELPMNPGRITGLCGRLRCCLAFEHPLYRSFRDRAPAVGRTVATPKGGGSSAATRC